MPRTHLTPKFFALLLGCGVLALGGCAGVTQPRGQMPDEVESVPPLELTTPTTAPVARVGEPPPVPPDETAFTLPPVPTLPPPMPTDETPLPPPAPLPPLPSARPVLGSPLFSPPPVVGAPAVGQVTVGGAPVTLEQVHGLFGGGQILSPGCGTGTCGTCGGGGCNACEQFPRTGPTSKVVGAMYDLLCCPDPCYQPKWYPLADSAFFVNSARPVTHTRLREEYTNEMKFPDRSEFYWARADGRGKGPRLATGFAGVPRVDAHELSMYTETAAGPGFSAFVSVPYRSVNPVGAVPGSAAGFSDLSLGTKSVLFDSELLLLSLQFKTTLPVGQPGKGLGTGHVSLEPALLFGVRTSAKSYLQGEIAEWIPIGGDPTYSGAMLHYHLSYNHTLWQPVQAVQLVGTLELNGYSLQDGGYTDPDGGFRKASGTNFLQMGPGMRLFFCDKYDFGVGSNFGVTGGNSLGQQFRFEFRVRY